MDPVGETHVEEFGFLFQTPHFGPSICKGTKMRSEIGSQYEFGHLLQLIFFDVAYHWDPYPLACHWRSQHLSQ